MALLAADPDNQSSIVGSLRAARENARGAREAISSEMWESLNATYHALPDLAELVGVGPARAVPLREGARRHGRRAGRQLDESATTAGGSWCSAAASSAST